jgi:hypothetical protein
MQRRLDREPGAMRIRRQTVEHEPEREIHRVSRHAQPVGHGSVRFGRRPTQSIERFDAERRIWASVTNVRDAQELEACQALGMPFVTGPAVCDPQPRPLGARVVSLDHLPIRSAG